MRPLHSGTARARRGLTLILAVSTALALACKGDVPDLREGAGRPRLVVLITVDQLGQDLLEPLAEHLDGGLGRMLAQGRWYTNAWVEHAITVSHPGHVTLATGMDPRHHGIVDAAFYVSAPNGRVLVDAVRDSGEVILGGDGLPGVSPKRILSTGLWDWMDRPGARRLAVSTGRYASLLYARTPGDVYWFDRTASAYVTSSFYRSEYPDWLTSFNRDSLPVLMADTVWDVTVPERLRGLAREDSATYESGGLHPYFPHRFHEEVPRDHWADPAARSAWFASTPMMDGATLALARDGVRALQLGQRDATDLLVIVVSQVDDIGHWYGSRSLEQLDNLLRLDRELGDFLDFLDRTVGGDGYVVALSADHAAPEAPEQRRANGMNAYRVAAEDVDAAQAGAKRAASLAGADPALRARAVAASLERLPWIADAMTGDELGHDEPAGPYLDLYRRSYRQDRVARYPVFSFAEGTSEVAKEGVMVRLEEQAMLDLDVVVHGSPYPYDRHVPLVFFGAGITSGRIADRSATRDLAPTLAAWAGVPDPRDRDGRVLRLGPGGGKR